MALDGIYSEGHTPEALGLSKEPSTFYAIFLLDEVLPQSVKFSKALQAVQLDLSTMSTLVDTTLHMLEAAIEPSVYSWLNLEKS